MQALSWRLRQLALATPAGRAWSDVHGSLTWRQLDAAVTNRARSLSDGPVLTTSEIGRDAWIATLAGIRAGDGAVLASPTLGRDQLAILADEHAPRHGVVVTSSGTTGDPKRVARRGGPAAAVQLAALASRLPLLGVRAVACAAPVDRGHGFQTACMALLAGVSYVDVARADAANALALLAERRVEILTGIPVQLARLATGSFSAPVRDVVSGSDVLAPELAARLGERFGARVWSCYGSTETGTVTVASPDDLSLAPTTVGRPIPGVRVRADDGVLAIRSPLGGRRWHRLDRGHVRADGLVFLDGRVEDSPA